MKRYAACYKVWGYTGDEDVQAGPHRGVEERRGLAGERTEPHHVRERVGPHHVLADVDREVRARDVGDHDVEPLPARQPCVDERAGQVEPPAGGLEHPFHQVAHLLGGQDRAGQLGDAAPGDVHVRRRIDPDLLDLRIVQVRLQRSQPANSVMDLPDNFGHVWQLEENAARGAVRIVRSGLLHELGEPLRFGHRVHATTPDELAHLALQQGDPVGSCGIPPLDDHACVPSIDRSHSARSGPFHRSRHSPPPELAFAAPPVGTAHADRRRTDFKSIRHDPRPTNRMPVDNPCPALRHSRANESGNATICTPEHLVRYMGAAVPPIAARGSKSHIGSTGARRSDS